MLKRLLHVQDTEQMEYSPREWRWMPSISFEGGRVTLGWELQLIRWKGEPHEPRVIGVYCVQFYYNPLLWKLIDVYHSWYDGPNCHWQVGPFAYGRFGLGNCSKCSGAL